MKSTYILSNFIITLSVFWFLGCDSLSIWSERIEIGSLNKIKEGKKLIHVELKHTINAWHIIFGDVEEYEKIKKIDKQILDQKLTVYIFNRNGVELSVKSNAGLIDIQPNSEKNWYYGSLSDLIFKSRSIQTALYFGEAPCKYDIRIEFENKDMVIDTDTPIRVIASWSDTL